MKCETKKTVSVVGVCECKCSEVGKKFKDGGGKMPQHSLYTHALHKVNSKTETIVKKELDSNPRITPWKLKGKNPMLLMKQVEQFVYRVYLSTVFQRVTSYT